MTQTLKNNNEDICKEKLIRNKKKFTEVGPRK